MTTRQALHQLLDELPDELLEMAEERLAALRDDPFLRFLMTAPVDDEPLDDEDLAALAETRAEFERGETIPWEMVREELHREAECPGD
ncbi:MAG TPA: hypothetical protein VK066_12435 [Chloroflexota bacterium]|nr:hypothetical protein [Chloroflexota bacterium]